MSKHFDIVIVGGGMVGTALACALQNSHYTVALIEGHEPLPLPSWPENEYDLRVSAITRASQHIFRALGVWDEMVKMRVSPFREMFVWDATGKGKIHFDSADLGEASLGHIVENRVTQWALFQQARSQQNLTLFCPDKPTSLLKQTLPNQGYVVQLDSGEDLSCQLLVAADGARSWVRRQVGITLKTHDYQQTAVVATVRTEKPHRETAWQRFLPTGPLAFLPLTEGYSSIVWSTTAQQAEQLLEMKPEEFRSQLQQAFDNKLGDIIESSDRAAFPLKSRHADHYVLPHLALIGDAAHTIHPLAGQGVNLGLADAAALAQVITEANSCCSFRALRRYERWRKGENLTMQTAMTGFKTLFSNDDPILSQTRNFGLSLADRMTPVKNVFIRHAMGLEGDLATIARG